MVATLLILGCSLSAQAAELTYATVKKASSGKHSLSLGTAPFANYGFNSFGYDGSIPGPTFRAKPGENLIIELTNNLQAANDVPCSQTGGEFCHAGSTNLHTHGLHVSSKGVEDGWAYYGDDILADVNPGVTVLFNFSIPSYHMGGTHWYHPHHHHATALQAGGGAAGLLIVDDPDGYLPKEYSSMKEKVLFISGHNLNTLQQMAQSARSGVLENAATTARNAGLDTNVFLVNGQIGPTMTIQADTYYRLRMVYAAVEQTLQLTMRGNATCTMKLLAKDGIYLNQIPRDISTVYLYPGARADVAVACSCAAHPCVGIVSAVPEVDGDGDGDEDEDEDDRRLQGGDEDEDGDGGGGWWELFFGGGDGPQAAGANAATVDLLVFSIQDSQSGSTLPALPNFVPRRPCYLADLRSATVSGTADIELDDDQMRVLYNGRGQSMRYAAVHANGGNMRSWTPMGTLQAGNAYAFNVEGVDEHPFHMHVNPFQITSLGWFTNSVRNGYFQVGDWHDTLMLGTQETVGIRLQTDAFTGKMVVHCHILEHEDEGMMNIIQVDGTEGSTFAAAETLDPTCYRDSIAVSTSDKDTKQPTATKKRRQRKAAPSTKKSKKKTLRKRKQRGALTKKGKTQKKRKQKA